MKKTNKKKKKGIRSTNHFLGTVFFSIICEEYDWWR